MAKEKLKFKISGKSIVYEGFPEQRAKDLMDILAKIGVNESTVVQTFRDNIENEADYTDEQISSMFGSAVQAREEKKRAKAAASGGESASPKTASPAAPPSTQDEAEAKQRIVLSFRGKQFSYEGYPSEKQKAVVQLLSKQRNVTQELAVSTFRDNLPASTATDEEIWALVREKAQGRGSSAAAASSSANTSETLAAPTTGTGTDYSAIDELQGMSAKERDELNSFIKQVLEQPQMDVAAYVRNEPRPATAKDEEADLLAKTQTRTAGKIPIYLEEKDVSGKKLIYATPQMTFEEFDSIVEKKFGRKMAMTFYEGDDVIQLDDDDLLAMFLEMNLQSGGKRIVLNCSNPSERHKPALDELNEVDNTTTTQVSTTKAKAYSNGQLSVKEVRTYPGHSLAVYCCAFSPKGDQFVTASRDRSVRLWNLRTSSCTVMKGGHNGFVLSCDFSPKGNRVVSSSDDRTIKIWNTLTSSKVSTLKGHEDKVYCVQYNSDGKYIVSGSCDHTVRVWDADACTKVATLKGHTLAVFSCCFSCRDRGKYVVSGSDDRLLKIWDWEAGKEVRSMVGHIGTVWSVKYSHNDAFIVSASMDHELKLWDPATGSCIRTMAGHKTPIHHAVFSDDDKYIFSCGRDWTVMVWRTESGEHVETITGHLSTVYHVDVQGSKMLTSSLDDTLKLWDVKVNK